MERANSPYICHIFVCVNDRGKVRKACADNGGAELKERIKTAVSQRGWKPRVRVSQSGCFGLCAAGPNVILYPQGIWFKGVQLDDVEAILAEVERLLAETSVPV